MRNKIQKKSGLKVMQSAETFLNSLKASLRK